MTLNYELDLDWVKRDHHAKYLGQRSFHSNVIKQNTQTHAHNGSIAQPGPL